MIDSKYAYYIAFILVDFLALCGCSSAPKEIPPVTKMTAVIPKNQATGSIGLTSEEAKKALEKTAEEIENIINQRTPRGSNKTQVVLSLRAKNKKAKFRYFVGKEIEKHSVIASGIFFLNYKKSDIGSVLYSSEDFTARGNKFQTADAFLFDKKGKLIKGFVFVLMGKPTLNEVKDMVRKEVLIGSSKARVESWLKSKKMESWYQDGKESDLDNESDVLFRSKYKAADLSGLLRSTIHSVGFTFPLIWNIKIVFYMGKNGKLKGYSVKQIGDGP